MDYTKKVLYMLTQFPNSKYIFESKVTALMYIIDQEGSNSSTAKYTRDDTKISARVSSNRLINVLLKLEENGFVQITERITFGGESRTAYRVTPEGIKYVQNDQLESINKEHIESMYDKYGDYPISNLLKYIRENYYTVS